MFLAAGRRMDGAPLTVPSEPHYCLQEHISGVKLHRHRSSVAMVAHPCPSINAVATLNCTLFFVVIQADGGGGEFGRSKIAYGIRRQSCHVEKFIIPKTIGITYPGAATSQGREIGSAAESRQLCE